MRFVAVGFILAVAWGVACLGGARADEAAPVAGADRLAIEQVITSQIEAFLHDAAEAAFGFASPKIQRLFGDAGHFMGMVRQGYAPVYRPRSFTFEALTRVEGRLVQRVMLVGPDGAETLALYTMEREADGSWRIDGCELTRPEGRMT